jgi:hypothetical protein
MQYSDKLRKQIKDLTLMLLYLNSFGDEGSCRSWKGYDFDDLNRLAEEGLISEGRRAKSVVLYDEGIERAKELCTEYGLELSEAKGK